MSGSVPDLWVEAKLEDVVEICDNLREPVNAKERESRVGPYPYYGATGQVGWIDSYRQDGEFVLLGEDGAPFFDSLKPKAYLVSGKAWVNNHAHVLKGLSDVCLNKYLMYSLNFTDYRGYANGTTRLKLTQEAMRRLPIRLAPPATQSRIVDKVEELFSDLDVSVAALERARANLKRYRASVLKAAVEGRLTAAWRRQNPPAETASQLLERILAERRRKWEETQLAKFAAAGKTSPKGWKDKYPEPAKPDTAKLPELPEGWCWALIDQLCEVGTGTTPSRGNAKYWTNGSVPWVASAAVNKPYVFESKECVTEEAVQETTLRVYPKHTLILALYGEGKTRGKISELMIPATINQALAALQTEGVSADCRQYLKTFMLSNYENLRRNSAGGVQPNLNLGLVQQIAVPLPPLCEQAEIVLQIEVAMSSVEASEKAIESGLFRSGSLRQSILKRAFEGKLVPQDPSDEPASVLLERIRAARADAPKAVARRGRKPKSG